MKELKYVITDREGIHARPAGQLVKEANKFESAIKIGKGEKSADAKRIFGVMGLAAKKDEEIFMSAEGSDEAAAIEALEVFLKENL
ncbi:MAG: HPr family phosphocarrier protein [Lachnospiraceae bacterium]|nr:HPr family phosphocarrier protein [Lachnospiraceae bacterium]